VEIRVRVRTWVPSKTLNEVNHKVCIMLSET
jgi:hypothetical protein